MTAENPKVTGTGSRNHRDLGKLWLLCLRGSVPVETSEIAIKVGTVEAEQIELKLLRIKLANKVR
jgi:hypothetical protein